MYIHTSGACIYLTMSPDGTWNLDHLRSAQLLDSGSTSRIWKPCGWKRPLETCPCTQAAHGGLGPADFSVIGITRCASMCW